MEILESSMARKTQQKDSVEKNKDSMETQNLNGSSHSDKVEKIWEPLPLNGISQDTLEEIVEDDDHIRHKDEHQQCMDVPYPIHAQLGWFSCIYAKKEKNKAKTWGSTGTETLLHANGGSSLGVLSEGAVLACPGPNRYLG
ncbi:hypothetical protein ACH5RR_012773 [Cinchona calisaya]|uniref:Uncharacterized protein n=1 Tax=Cinchona calisaya TaxID=153742 RepID=A0ABD3A8S9_9GENT